MVDNLYVLKDINTNIKAEKHIKNNSKIITLNSTFKEAKCPKLKISNSTKEKLRSNQLGRKAINNGLITKYVFKEDLDNYLNQGWKLGMLKRK